MMIIIIVLQYHKYGAVEPHPNPPLHKGRGLEACPKLVTLYKSTRQRMLLPIFKGEAGRGFAAKSVSPQI
ncbi:hypothetical protein EDI28_01195 [Photobacterium chitinilyticum]|uniref:Uncharacterized protein n=1 Tax=Photobacterium chitinilyticum TaxID=2485123 RepID=A0A444JUH0_9GAMM|nr:hypothetical protein EDI28_01195 [Photobacterium chitinilyticum]